MRAGVLARLRARLAARPDTEHEQALVRVVVGALVLVYLLPGASLANLEPTLLLMLGFFLVAAVILGQDRKSVV